MFGGLPFLGFEIASHIVSSRRSTGDGQEHMAHVGKRQTFERPQHPVLVNGLECHSTCQFNGSRSRGINYSIGALPKKMTLDEASQLLSNWIAKNPVKFAEQKAAVEHYGKLFLPENIDNLTEEQFRAFLLFKNNRRYSKCLRTSCCIRCGIRSERASESPGRMRSL